MMYILLRYVVFSVWIFNIVSTVPPVINNLPNSTSLLEDTSTEIRLYTIDATDADGDSITCSFGPGTVPGTGTSKFSVKLVSSAWGIYTTGNGYDYSSQSTYALEIDCDANGDTATEMYTVYLAQNQAPVILNLPTSVNLSTLTGAIGDNVFMVNATDTENDQITFVITCDPLTPACPFEVFSSGAIQLNADISDSTLAGYDVTVDIVDDNGNIGTSKILTVIMTDINNQPQIQNLGSTITVPENTALNNSLVTTACTDSDAIDTLIYTMTCIPATGSTYFQISSSSGDIATSPTSLINYEYILSTGSTSFACTVTCNDGRASDTATVTFDVIDVNEAPQFSQHSYSISADEGPGGTVIQVTSFSVIDEDSGDSQTFNLDCGTSTGFFAINSSTGIISYSIDYDVDDGIHPASVSCNVTVFDSGGFNDTAAVSITINNLNDNVPVFSQSSYVWFISEADPVGTTVGTAAATDEDIGTFGNIIYSLDQSTLTAEYFQIDQSGVLTIKATYGAGATPTFYAIATDGGGNETRVPVSVIIAATTTTTTTTTSSDRYKRFFDDGRNIAWFTALCILIVVTFVVVLWMCLLFSGKPSNGFSQYRFRCCRYREDVRPRKPRNWGEDHRGNFRSRRPIGRRASGGDNFQLWSENYKQLD